MSNKTVIAILNEVFQDRDYDLSLLSIEEFKDLSNRLTVFASEYEAPPRPAGTSRYYAGGTAWNSNQVPQSKVWFGPAGLQYGADMAIVQTLCLMHDSVACHDPVTDMIGAHKADFLSPFFSNLYEGEIITDSDNYGTKSITKETIENAAARLNPTLRVYDQARKLIERGHLLPVPTRVLLVQNQHSVETQLRYAGRDSEMLRIAAESKTIPTNDGVINVFMQPNGSSKISVGLALDNPALRLHYGIMHHLKCLLVAFKASADFAPFDDFGWNTLAYKYDELAKNLFKKSLINLAKTVATSNLAIPIVRGFSVQDIVSIRHDEEVFEELRTILRRSAEPVLVSRDLSEFYDDYERQALDAIEQWRGSISAFPHKRNLFKNTLIAGGSALAVASAIMFATEDPVSSIIKGVSGVPGLYYGLKDLLVSGQDPKQRLFKIMRRYSFSEQREE